MTRQAVVQRGLVLLGAIGVAAGLSAQGGQPTFKTGVDMVHFGVTVVDKKGNYLTDLRQEDFEVYEDGQKQALRFFVPCDAQGGHDASAAIPPSELHLGALLDISGSMEADMAFARSAAIKFLNSLSEARDFTLVDFDTEVRVTRYSQSEFGRLVERIRSRKAETATRPSGTRRASTSTARRARTAGRSSCSTPTAATTPAACHFGDLTDLLKASDVTVHAIGFLEHQSASARMDLRARLHPSGGADRRPGVLPVVDEGTGRGLREGGRRDRRAVLDGLRLDEREADGTWRKVEIKVTRPGVKDVKVRTRQGYFAPLKEGAAGTP